MKLEPMPCSGCLRAPNVQSRILDKENGGPACWIVGCPRCKWNNTGYHSTEKAAIEHWNRLQEMRKDYA